MLHAVDPTGAITTSVQGVFLQFGVLGAFALVSLFFFFRVYKRESERADKAESALADLNREVRDRVIPAVTESTRAVADAAATMRDRR